MDPRTDLSNIAGSNSMAAPGSSESASYARAAGGGSVPRPQSSRSKTQTPAQAQLQSQAHGTASSADGGPAKKKRHRAGKKRRNRRQSFIAQSDTATELEPDQRPSLADANRPSAAETSFYRLKSAARSNTSLESEALLDHRSVSIARLYPLPAARDADIVASFSETTIPYAPAVRASSSKPCSPLEGEDPAPIALRQTRCNPQALSKLVPCDLTRNRIAMTTMQPPTAPL